MTRPAYISLPDLCLDHATLERCYSRFTEVLDAQWPVPAIFDMLLGQIRDPYKFKLLATGIEKDNLATQNQQLTLRAAQLEERNQQLDERNQQTTLHAAHLEERNQQLDERNQQTTLRAAHLEERNHESTLHAAQLEERNQQLTLNAVQLEERNQQLTLHGAHLEERNQQSTLHAAQLEERNQQSTLHAAQLEERNQLLYDSNAKLQNKLEVLFFSQPLVKPMLFGGSVSRADAWKVVKALPSYLGTGDLPGDPEIIQQVYSHASHHILDARRDRFVCETDLYEPMVSLLKRYFECSSANSTSNQELEWCPEACVLDTHNKKYLDSNAPDISIFLQGTTQPDPSSLCVVIDMKYSARIGSDEEMGQIYDYLLHMRRAQPGRQMLVGVLSNLDSNIVLTMQAGHDPRIVRHKPVALQQLIAYLATVVLTEQPYRPPDLGFSPALGTMLRRLGAPTNNVVAMFKIPGEGRKTMAVKRRVGDSTNTISREAELLRLMTLRPDKPDSIPDLVYLLENDDSTGTPRMEFGIYPVGSTLEPGIFPNHRQFSTALLQILKALHWLHNSALLIHRDVRSDNIVLHPTRGAVLIDFDNAFDNSTPGQTIYRGGYICCPPTHIRTVAAAGCWLEMYTPLPAHDYLAWLLLVNCLLFPAPMGWLRSNMIARPEGRVETEKILSLWETMEQSAFWGKYVTAAENENIETLGQVLELIVHL